LAVYLIPICIFHILIASSLVALISQNFMDSSYTFVSLIKNKFANDLLLIMTCYILMFLMIRNHQLFSRTKKSITNKTLTIKTGNQIKLIQLNDIDWIQAETPYIGIWIKQKKYLYQSTLSKILTELDSEKFIRIHRSTIVNILEVEHIESRSNGDYDLFLWDKTVLRLSRNYRQNLNHTQLKP
jgi:DNA-binding LytR/AlgR family response regulator